MLYPNLLGTALIPVLLGAVLLAFAPAAGWTRRTLRILIVLAIVGSTGLAHPSALLGAVALWCPTCSGGHGGSRSPVGGGRACCSAPLW